jgi:hypothetical protein
MMEMGILMECHREMTRLLDLSSTQSMLGLKAKI